jgi:DNA-binding LacI/PurR family transcriptional regulator
MVIMAKKQAEPNKGSRATAKDVARLAGVSQSTVSRILSGDSSPFFSEKTRRKVLKVAAELNYSPNPLARALRGKQTQLIGLIMRGINDPFLASLVSEISMQARSLGYQVVLGHAQSDPNEVLQISNVLDTRHTDGVIILGDFKEDQAAIREILEGRRAVVAICRGDARAEAVTINSDNQAGMHALLDHLTSLGHRRLAFIDGGWAGDFKERGKVYAQYLDEHHLEIRPEWTVVDSDDPIGGYQAMQRLLSLAERPTAVLASDDIIALGALKAAHDAGLRVPKDISITGFDGIDLTRYVSPGLTTVRQPIEEMSRRALTLLLEIIAGKTLESEQLIRIQPELVVRQSTGPAPSKIPTDLQRETHLPQAG